MVTEAEFEAANRRMNELLDRYPHAIAARYDAALNRVVIALSNGRDFSFKPDQAQGLERAKPSQLRDIEIGPAGISIYFPKLDADLYLPSLLDGNFGTRKWMAAQLGAKGGRAKTPAKVRASRENGKRGGRPKKAA